MSESASQSSKRKSLDDDSALSIPTAKRAHSEAAITTTTTDNASESEAFSLGPIAASIAVCSSPTRAISAPSTSASSSSVTVPPAFPRSISVSSPLYADAIKAMLKFFSLSELHQAASLSKAWYQAVRRMGSIGAETKLAVSLPVLNLLQTIRGSAVALHIGRLAFGESLLTADLLRQVHSTCPSLFMLRCRIDVNATDIFKFSSTLTHFTLDVRSTTAALNHARQTHILQSISSMHSLQVFVLSFARVDLHLDFSPLLLLSNLRCFSFQWGNHKLNNLGTMQWETIQSMTSLRTLFLFEGQMNVECLRKLTMNESPLVQHLQYLDFSRTDLTIDHLPLLQLFSAINHIAPRICFTCDLDFLQSFPQLTRLDLRCNLLVAIGNPFTAAAAAAAPTYNVAPGDDDEEGQAAAAAQVQDSNKLKHECMTRIAWLNGLVTIAPRLLILTLEDGIKQEELATLLPHCNQLQVLQLEHAHALTSLLPFATAPFTFTLRKLILRGVHGMRMEAAVTELQHLRVFTSLTSLSVQLLSGLNAWRDVRDELMQPPSKFIPTLECVEIDSKVAAIL